MRRLYFILLFLFSFAQMFSQQVIDSKVEVNREFEGKLIEYVKSPLSTVVSDTLMKFDIKFDYSVFDRPYKELYEFTPMQSVPFEQEQSVRYPIFYSKVSVGYPWLANADLYLQRDLAPNFSMLIYYNHNSFWGRLPEKISSSYADEMTNKVGVSSGFSWKTGELSLGVEYSNNYYSYYGFSSDFLESSNLNLLDHSFFRDSLSNTYDLVRVNLGVTSKNPNPTSFYYNFSLGYNYLADSPTVFLDNSPVLFNENIIDLSGEIGATILSKHRVLLGFNSLSIMHKGGRRDYAKSLFEITPKYVFGYNRWKLNAGVTIAFSYLNNVSEQDIANIYPDVSVDYEVVKDDLWAYLKLDGENDFYSMMSLLQKNPWVGDSLVRSTAIPFRAKLGLKGVVNDKFSYSVFASYSYVNDLMSFEAKDNVPFQYSTYNDNQFLAAGVQMLWRSEGFEAGADFLYNYYQDQKGVFMLPEVQASLNAKYNYRKRFSAELICHYRGSVFSSLGPESQTKISGFVDLGVNLSYSLSPSVSFFIEGKNLLNQKIQYVENYIQPGVNIGAGVCLKF